MCNAALGSGATCAACQPGWGVSGVALASRLETHATTEPQSFARLGNSAIAAIPASVDSCNSRPLQALLLTVSTHIVSTHIVRTHIVRTQIVSCFG